MSYRAYTKFQPTLPMRGATILYSRTHRSSYSFNPRSPCGERPVAAPAAQQQQWFQPTLPMRGATSIDHQVRKVEEVSTHAPHAGSDFVFTCKNGNLNCFNPRSPCGERRSHTVQRLISHMRFNPRSPCGERLRVRCR